MHRPTYLDYVGVKRFDADGRVVGERRFLGLFASTAYTRVVPASRSCASKVRRVLERAGFTPRQPLRQGPVEVLENYPRDELFQTAVGRPGRHRPGGAAPAGASPDPAVPAPRRLWPVRVLPGLPAARPLHHRRPAEDGRTSCGETFDAETRRLHGSGHRVGAGPAALRGPRAQGRARPGRRRGGARARARRGHPFLGRGLRRGPAGRRAARRPAVRLARGVRRRVPRGLQGGLPAGASRVADVGRARGRSTPTTRSSSTLYQPPDAAPRTSAGSSSSGSARRCR